jgi:hypothetical protein
MYLFYHEYDNLQVGNLRQHMLLKLVGRIGGDSDGRGVSQFKREEGQTRIL